MEFSGLFFLYALLPLILFGFFLLPDVGRRNTFLIVVSFLLYAMYHPLYVPLLLLQCRVNYKMAMKIKKERWSTVMMPIAWNLAVLLLLKYVDPLLLVAGIGVEHDGLLIGLAAKLVDVLNGFGMSLNAPATLAPLGISFFTLTAVSYLLDVYRGKHPAERSFKSFLLHMTLFPKLFQGPLVRYEHVALQLKERRENFRHVFEGALRFCTGLGKKVLLADYCGRMISELAAVKSDQALIGSWLTAVLFLFRVYYDFSGCCDMAVGLGRIFGFRFPENFNLPYTAMSVGEFCERWNLTLGHFFRDYVYDPLCKKREGKLNRAFALAICVLLAALWHGGTFNFLIWGLYFAVLILLEEQCESFLLDLPYWLRHVLTILAVLLGWVIFMSTDVNSLGNALKAMIGNGGLNVVGDGQRVMSCIPLISACWIGATSVPRKLRSWWRGFCGVAGKRGQTESSVLLRYAYLASCFVFLLVVLWWCTVSRTGTVVQPSIFMHL